MARPLVFAHRGSSYDLPEHTLGACLRALDEGADGLECDVRLTRDGHLVCIHDRRLDRTSNGHGPVSTHTLAELEGLDFGSWHPGPARANGNEVLDESYLRLLTLDRLLEATRAFGRPVRLLIETKHPSRYGRHVERRLVALLERHGLTVPRPDHPLQVTAMSFSLLAVRRLRALAPALPAVLLLDRLPRGFRLNRLPFGIQIAGPGLALMRAHPTLVPALQAAGNQVYVWTVNKPRDLELVLDAGVDGIITDRPAPTLTRLHG